jgi:hypothetical protein
MNFNKIYEVTHNRDALLQPIENGSPIREGTNQLLNLKDYIHTILFGTAEEKTKLAGQFFFLAETPQFMKDLGLTGEYFEVKYGVITRHKGKDQAYNLIEQNWIDLCDKIVDPVAIATYKDTDNRYCLFTEVRISSGFVAVGIDVKNVDRALEINAITTTFEYEGKIDNLPNLIYKKSP